MLFFIMGCPLGMPAIMALCIDLMTEVNFIMKIALYVLIHSSLRIIVYYIKIYYFLSYVQYTVVITSDILGVRGTRGRHYVSQTSRPEER